MNSRERDTLTWLFREALQPYAEARTPAGAWQAVERRLYALLHPRRDWRGWLHRLSSENGVGLDALLSPACLPGGVRLNEACLPAFPFVALSFQNFALRSVA